MENYELSSQESHLKNEHLDKRSFLAFDTMAILIWDIITHYI